MNRSQFEDLSEVLRQGEKIQSRLVALAANSKALRDGSPPLGIFLGMVELHVPEAVRRQIGDLLQDSFAQEQAGLEKEWAALDVNRSE